MASAFLIPRLVVLLLLLVDAAAFEGATSFNADISSWDTSQTKGMPSSTWPALSHVSRCAAVVVVGLSVASTRLVASSF